MQKELRPAQPLALVVEAASEMHRWAEPLGERLELLVAAALMDQPLER